MPIFPIIPHSEVWLHTPGAGAAGQGTTDTQIRRYTVEEVIGTALTVATTLANGSVVTVVENGLYEISASDALSTGAVQWGVSKNSNQLTTGVFSITAAHRLPIYMAMPTAADSPQSTAIVRLVAGDLIRRHENGTVCNKTNLGAFFRIIKISH